MLMVLIYMTIIDMLGQDGGGQVVRLEQLITRLPRILMEIWMVAPYVVDLIVIQVNLKI